MKIWNEIKSDWDLLFVIISIGLILGWALFVTVFLPALEGK